VTAFFDRFLIPGARREQLDHRFLRQRGQVHLDIGRGRIALGCVAGKTAVEHEQDVLGRQALPVPDEIRHRQAAQRQIRRIGIVGQQIAVLAFAVLQHLAMQREKHQHPVVLLHRARLAQQLGQDPLLGGLFIDQDLDPLGRKANPGKRFRDGFGVGDRVAQRGDRGRVVRIDADDEGPGVLVIRAEALGNLAPGLAAFRRDDDFTGGGPQPAYVIARVADAAQVEGLRIVDCGDDVARLVVRVMVHQDAFSAACTLLERGRQIHRPPERREILQLPGTDGTDDHLARGDADADVEKPEVHAALPLVAQLRERGGDVEGAAQCALFVAGLAAKQRHHAVAEEFVHHSVVLDDVLRQHRQEFVEAAGDVFRFAECQAHAREPAHVGEHHGHPLEFCRRRELAQQVGRLAPARGGREKPLVRQQVADVAGIANGHRRVMRKVFEQTRVALRIVAR
jgi:hypothetical protein